MLETLINIALTLLGLCLSLTMMALYLCRMLFQIIKNPRGFFYVKDRPTPPKVLTEGWTHGKLAVSQDVNLHYVVDGAPQRPLMLFVHGFPEFWYSWRNQLKAFKSDYRVVAIDLRGYGDSDKPSSILDYSIDNLVQDVKQTIKQLDYSSCTLVAHDWGGAIAWQVALRHPELVDKLIICNCPHPTAFRQALRGNPKQMIKSWYMFFFQCPKLPEMMLRAFDLGALEQMFTDSSTGGCKNPEAFTKEDIEAFKYTFGKPGAFTPPINFYRAAFAAGRLSRNAASITHAVSRQKVQPPVLIIWGTKDIALTTEMAQASADSCESATVRYVDGASHWVQNDNPDVVNRYMREFLKGEAN